MQVHKLSNIKAYLTVFCVKCKKGKKNERKKRPLTMSTCVPICSAICWYNSHEIPSPYIQD